MNIIEVFEALSKQMMNLKFAEMERLSGDLNLSLLQYIFAIGDRKDMTFSDLAEKMEISKPAVTAVANKLIDKGLAVKSQTPQDARSFYIILTEKGLGVWGISKMADAILEEQIRARLSEDEVRQLANLLGKITK
ncbi:hypothetical protein FACS18948_1980 [Clostridia bacterium]|nr:hypothetical protein FACS18948_1980 [Clostridia bacterium]